jgi:predicted nucleic acid-binding protein
MGLTVPTLLYLDTNCLIAIVERRELAELVEGVVERIVRFVTSEITLAEVLVRPLQTGDDELVAAYERVLSDPDFIDVIPIDRDLIRDVAVERAKTGTKIPDAIHVVSAVRTGCTHFLSSDKRLRIPPGLVRTPEDQAARRENWPW